MCAARAKSNFEKKKRKRATTTAHRRGVVAGHVVGGETLHAKIASVPLPVVAVSRAPLIMMPFVVTFNFQLATIPR